MAEVRVDQNKKKKLEKKAALVKGLQAGAFNNVPLVGGMAALFGGAVNKVVNERASARSAAMPPRQDLGRTPLRVDPLTNRQADPNAKRRGTVQRDPMQELLDALNQRYEGTMPGFDDAEATAALDAAFGTTMQGITGLRDRTNQNFTESDQNLQSMHTAYQNDIANNGAAAFNKIADQHGNSIVGNRDSSVQALTALQDDSRAKREAMLRNLGLEASAAAPESTELQDAQQSIISRSNADKQSSDNIREANLAYNTGAAQSVGAAGLERRAALQRQLGEAMGTIDAKEMDARSAYQQQRASMASQKAGMQNDRAQFEYGMFRDEQDGIRGILDQMMNAQGETPEAPVIKGYAGLAQDLVNSGIDQNTASNAMRAHAQLMSSPEYQNMKNRGQDPTPYMLRSMQEQFGIPPSVAIQLVTNYGNLGNTSGFAALG